MKQRGATLHNVTAGDDGTALVTFRLAPEDADHLVQDRQIGAAVCVGLESIDDCPETASKWIRSAVHKISKATGRPTQDVKRELMERGAAPATADGRKIYMVAYDDRSVQTLSTVYARRTPHSTERGWHYYKVLQPVADHRGEDLRQLLTVTNAMLSEAGIPEAEQVSERAIEFYIDQAGGGHDAI